MWIRLADAKLVPTFEKEMYASHWKRERNQALLPLLIALAERVPWAFAVTSLAEVRITTDKHGARRDDRLGWIHVFWKAGDSFAVELVPPGLNHASRSFEGDLEATADTVAGWAEELRQGLSFHPLDEPTDDVDLKHPAFPEGTAVRVLPKGGRNTPRTGEVASTVWHGKHERWTYWLRVEGELRSKRYFAVDLERV